MIDLNLVNQLIAAKCARYSIGQLAADYYDCPSDHLIEKIIDESILIARVADSKLTKQMDKEEEK